MLSRAFRNRFVELHFEDIPSQELEKILQQRCQLPHSYSKKMVSVMKDLQVCSNIYVVDQLVKCFNLLGASFNFWNIFWKVWAHYTSRSFPLG